MATELIKGYNRKSISPRCLMKVDLKKAYDSIEWSFLETVLHELGFPNLFVSWIMECVSSVSYSILINGKPCPPFPARKGLRQGDPISPFLFALGMEYLSRCFVDMTEDPNFNFHPRCEKLKITHLMFADDLLLFARADPISVNMMFSAFNPFSSASGLEANLTKSSVYVGGVSDEIATSIKESINMDSGS